jgi:hypothetical protein
VLTIKIYVLKYCDGRSMFVVYEAPWLGGVLERLELGYYVESFGERSLGSLCVHCSSRGLVHFSTA